MINLSFIIPEIFISLSVMFLLILGVFKKNSFELIHNLSIIVLLITGVIVFNETIDIEKILLFNGSVVIDYLSSFMKIITLLAAFIVLAISKKLFR
jgi:NADH-quinone oxidoreductase subunit N